MMNERTWNYRVLVFEENNEVIFQICEVYYENSVPVRYGKKTIPSSTKIEDLKWTIDQYKEAFNKPLLCGGSNFPKQYK